MNNIGTSRIISGSNNNTSRMKRKQQNNGIDDPKDSTIDWTRRRNHQLRLLPCCVCCFIVEKGLRLSGPMRERGNTSPPQNFYDQLYFSSSIYDMYLCAICNLLQIQKKWNAHARSWIRPNEMGNGLRGKHFIDEPL